MYKNGELPTPRMANGTALAERRFFLPSAYAAEEKIAIAVRRRTRRDGKERPAGEEEAGREAAGEEGAADAADAAACASLSDGQREAVRRAMREQLLVLTGGPGTGKTHKA